MHPVLRKVWRWVAGLIGTLVILLAMAVGLFRLFLPQLPEYRAQIEAWATQAIGRPLQIGSIDARLALNGPLVLFRDTVVLSADGRSPVLEADSISVVINPLVLLLEQRLSVSAVRIHGIDLEVERREDGRISVLNRVFPPEPDGQEAGSPPPEIPDGRFEIREASVRLVDARGGREPLVFRNAQLDIDKDDEDFSLGVRLPLPASLGSMLQGTLTTSSLGQAPAPGQWQLMLQADALSLEGWRNVLPENLAASLAGRGSSTLWFSFGAGQIANAIVDLDFEGLSLPDPGDQGPAVFERVSGNLEWELRADGWQLKVQALDMARDGRTWHADSIRVELAGKEEVGRVLYVSADALELGDLHPVLHRLPDSEPVLRLARLAPRGMLRDLNLQYSSQPGKPPHYSASARLEDVGFNADGAWPGVSRVSGSLQADEDGGQFILGARDLGFDMPRVFEQELLMDEARGEFTWRRNGQGLSILGREVVLANPDLYTYSSLELVFPGQGASPLANFETQIRNARISGKTKYLPIVKLPTAVREWLDRALVDGLVPEGRMVLRGPLDKYPFSGGEGQFRVEFAIQDLLLDYQQDWPPITGISADVRFDGPGLFVQIRDGNLAGSRLVGGQASIPSLGEGMLQIRGDTRGPATAGLEYLSVIPPGQDYREAIADLEVSGQAEVAVDLALPLKDISRHSLKLDMKIVDGAVRPLGLDRGLEQVNGRVLLEEGRLHGNEISATYLGSPARVDISPEPSETDNPATLMLLRGWSGAHDLAGQFFPPIQPYVDGRTDWFAVIRFPGKASGEPVSVSARTVLGGMRIDLPEPMRKAAQEVRLLELVYTMHAGQRRGLVLALGEDIRASLDLLQGDGGWRVDAGNVVLGGGVPARDGLSGLHITGKTPLLRLDQWLGLEQGEASDGAPRLVDMLQGVDLEVEDFRAFGQQLGKSRVKLANRDGSWVAELAGERAQGRMTVPQDEEAALPAEMVFQRLLLAADPDAPATEADPRQVRPFILRVDDFGLEEMRFGALEVSATRAPLGLSLDTLRTRHPAFQIDGAANWMVTDDGQISGLKATLVSTDLLATYQALGLGSLVRGEQGKIEADVYWRGQPGVGLMQSLSGQVRIEMRDGSIAEIEPGAGRALGLLSVAALPRRLSLDFSDVFAEGLAFDRISGDFNLVNGNAYTSNLVMDGPSVGIGITGRTGLLAKDYDQTAIVHANIGSSLPIAGALAGGPGLGAALFIFSEVFKEPLKGISRARYRITGSWQDPVVERVDAVGLKRPGQVAPESGEPLPDEPDESGQDTRPGPSAPPGQEGQG